MNNDAFTSKKLELQGYIEELESSLVELKQQLRCIELEEQHAAIDSLETYLETIDHEYENLKGFWTIISSEWRGLFGCTDKKTTSQDEE